MVKRLGFESTKGDAQYRDSTEWQEIAVINPFRLNEFHLNYLEGQIAPLPHPDPGSVSLPIKQRMITKIVETAKRNLQQSEVADLILSESEVMTEWLIAVTPLSWLNVMLIAEKNEADNSRCLPEISAYMTVIEMMGMYGPNKPKQEGKKPKTGEIVIDKELRKKLRAREIGR